METSSDKNPAVTGLSCRFVRTHYLVVQLVSQPLSAARHFCTTTASAASGRVPRCIFGAGELPFRAGENDRARLKSLFEVREQKRGKSSPPMWCFSMARGRSAADLQVVSTRRKVTKSNRACIAVNKSEHGGLRD